MRLPSDSANFFLEIACCAPPELQLQQSLGSTTQSAAVLHSAAADLPVAVAAGARSDALAKSATLTMSAFFTPVMSFGSNLMTMVGSSRQPASSPADKVRHASPATTPRT